MSVHQFSLSKEVSLAAPKTVKKVYEAWLKRCLREHLQLPDKIKRLELKAEGKRDFYEADKPQTKKPIIFKNALSEEERYLAEYIRAVMPDAFAKKPVGLLTRGRFIQQVRTMVRNSPELLLLVDNLINSTREDLVNISPVERIVFRHEEFRENAKRMMQLLRRRKMLFDSALAELEQYQPWSYELLQLRYMLRYSVAKVMLQLRINSESTYASYRREAMQLLQGFVKEQIIYLDGENIYE